MAVARSACNHFFFTRRHFEGANKCVTRYCAGHERLRDSLFGLQSARHCAARAAVRRTATRKLKRTVAAAPDYSRCDMKQTFQTTALNAQ